MLSDIKWSLTVGYIDYDVSISTYFTLPLGTDNHIVLWDARPTGISGSKLEKLFERCSISANKNTVLGDKSAISPGGIRLGTPSVTTRNMNGDDMKTIANFLHRIVNLGHEIDGTVKGGSRKLTDFIIEMKEDKYAQELESIRIDVENFASQYPLVGINPEEYG